MNIVENFLLKLESGFDYNSIPVTSYSDGTNTITYKYNLDGIRTSKVVNGINTTYYLEGRTIIFEDRNGDVLYYIYNGSELLGFVYKNKKCLVRRRNIILKITSFDKKIINDIYIHDFLLNDFSYNNLMGILTINLLSDRNELKNKSFVLNDIIYIEYNNVNFWGGDGVPFDCVVVDDNFTKFNELKSRLEEKSICPSKLKGDVIELSFYNLSGGELRIICRSIDYNEYDND